MESLNQERLGGFVYYKDDGNMWLSKKLEVRLDGARVSRVRTRWVPVLHSSGHFWGTIPGCGHHA